MSLHDARRVITRPVNHPKFGVITPLRISVTQERRKSTLLRRREKLSDELTESSRSSAVVGHLVV